MASPAYLSVFDENGEMIKSTVKVSGREDTIEIFAFEHNLEIPTDKHDGSLTGTRVHGNFSVIKNFCPASPIFYKACASGATLKKLVLSWYRISPVGDEEEYFRHTLENVRIVKIMPKLYDVKLEKYSAFGHREEIKFRYEKITWVYLDGNIETSDSWTKR